MRSIRQPGPPAPQRFAMVEVGMKPIDETLPVGKPLLGALAALLKRHAVESACLQLTGGSLAPFAYVIPSLSPDADHAAYYSETFRPAGETRLDCAALTLGYRDGNPFFHCHAIWTEADGRRGCGHILPEGTGISAPIRVTGAGVIGARFEARPDEETGFTLFAPYATETAVLPGARAALALRLMPNQDLIEALEHATRKAGFARAIVHGGVASIIEARFCDGTRIENFATEMLVRSGTIDPAPDIPSELDIAIVDYKGVIAEGRLVPGDNPVLMTFEGLLEKVQ